MTKKVGVISKEGRQMTSGEGPAGQRPDGHMGLHDLPHTTCFSDLFSPGFLPTVPQTLINQEEEKEDSGLPSQAPGITSTHADISDSAADNPVLQVRKPMFTETKALLQGQQ